MRRTPRIEVTVQPSGKRWAVIHESPHHTANRLAEYGLVDAIKLAHARMKVHAPTGHAITDAKRSVESYEKWKAVLVLLLRRIGDRERAALGMRPSATIAQPNTSRGAKNAKPQRR